MYMLFSGHSHRPHDEEGIRETTWKEVIHKARVKLLRVPLSDVYNFPVANEPGLHRLAGGPSNDSPIGNPGPSHVPSEGKAYEFAYQLLVVEDLNDDRVHTFEENEPQPGPFDDVALAGIRDIIPIHEISKIFYADTGKILNIGTEGETNNPILLLKRDVNAPPPRRMMENQSTEPQWYDDPSAEDLNQSEDEEEDDASAQLRRESSVALEEQEEQVHITESQPWRLPPNLDPEWIAFEVYTEDPPSDDEDESTIEEQTSPPTSYSRSRSGTPGVTSALENLHLNDSTPSTPSLSSGHELLAMPTPPAAIPALRTSLSLLELLIRLTALQQFQQSSHLAITDELLNFFLSDSSTTGAGADSSFRRRVRREARQRVGFDPYDESPIKRRGEEYLAEQGHSYPSGQQHWDEYEDDEGSYTPARHRSPGGVYPSSSGYRASADEDDGPPLPSMHSSAHRNLRSSPSPLLRKGVKSDRATPERQGSGGYSTPVTPPGTSRSRQAVLRRESEGPRPSPLRKGFLTGAEGRDSGVGTSPAT